MYLGLCESWIFDWALNTPLHGLLKITDFDLKKLTCRSAFHNFHCVKSVQIRIYFWSVFSRIRTEYGDLFYRKTD